MASSNELETQSMSSALNAMSLRKAGIVCGILAPVLWAASIAINGVLRPDFSHITQYISELGESGSRTELLMRYAGFLPTGLMHLAFAASLLAVFKGNRTAAIAAVLIGLNGLGRIGAGIYPCDLGCETTGSLNQRMHSLFATIGFVALIAAILLWSAVLKHERDLRKLAAYSLGTGILGLVFVLLMLGSPETGSARGLHERIASGVLSLWILVFAARLWRLPPPCPYFNRTQST